MFFVNNYILTHMLLNITMLTTCIQNEKHNFYILQPSFNNFLFTQNMSTLFCLLTLNVERLTKFIFQRLM